ncbi:right-handed parallel beta-helix repeat-containing protein, partial [bacterium]|nr:right-handed parallel beta-helix repeat-containing protein [bacterium]
MKPYIVVSLVIFVVILNLSIQNCKSDFERATVTPAETLTITPTVTPTLTPTETPIPGIINIPGDYSTIQAGIDAADTGDIVRVADGIYTGSGNTDMDFGGAAITVESANGWESCIIDCEMKSRAFYFHNNEDNRSVVRGFTFTNGGSEEISSGALIFCEYGSPVVRECIFINSVSSGKGGAIACQNNSSPQFIYCFFESNIAEQGGAIYCHNYASATITSCAFTGNIASGHGGAIYCHNEAFTIITDSYFIWNLGLNGGAIYCHSNASAEITNCVIAENLGENGGGFYYHNNASSHITNCTITGNYALEEGGALYSNVDSASIITSSIIWANLPDQIAGGAELSEMIDIVYSDIEGGFEGEGNIDKIPGFVKGPFGDYYLSQNAAGHAVDSPCIDAGHDLAANICFESKDGEECLDARTTRSDIYPDEETVDMGFHYPALTGCEELGVRIYMPLDDYTVGDEFFCYVYICNPSEDTYTDIPLFVILDVYGAMFFAPGFTDFDNYTVDIETGETKTEVIPHFFWPDIDGTVTDIIWYAAMTN